MSTNKKSFPSRNTTNLYLFFKRIQIGINNVVDFQLGGIHAPRLQSEFHPHCIDYLQENTRAQF